jgi:hypothetical protein
MVDLFGEVPVTIDDIERWLDEFVNFHGSPWRSANYALSWNVADKIRAAKLAGEWERVNDKKSDSTRFDADTRRGRLRLAFGLRVHDDDR